MENNKNVLTLFGLVLLLVFFALAWIAYPAVANTAIQHSSALAQSMQIMQPTATHVTQVKPTPTHASDAMVLNQGKVDPSLFDVRVKPSVSVAEINGVLCYYHSPTCGKGQALYNYGVQYAIDPAFALAFFGNESTFGTAGEATKTLALGNERCISDRPCVDQDRGGYAQFNSWEDGFEHWFVLIRIFYISQMGRTTVAEIIPKYAPNSDGNNETHYIATVEKEVLAARAGKYNILAF